MNIKFKKIKARDLHHVRPTNQHPADTYFHFSFAHYYNSKNLNFGVLQTFNDDEILPYSGFDTHSHKDIEIVSYIISGTLSHKDSATKRKGSLGPGSVQTVSAGRGIRHSELNQQDNPTRILQLWIQPSKKGLPPRYEYDNFAPKTRSNKLLHIVGNTKNRSRVPLHINQDVNIYVSEITDKSQTVSFTLEGGRQAYINNFEGDVTIKGITSLKKRDSLKIMGPAKLDFAISGGSAHFIIIEMPKAR